MTPKETVACGECSKHDWEADPSHWSYASCPDCEKERDKALDEERTAAGLTAVRLKKFGSHEPGGNFGLGACEADWPTGKDCDCGYSEALESIPSEEEAEAQAKALLEFWEANKATSGEVTPGAHVRKIKARKACKKSGL